MSPTIWFRSYWVFYLFISVHNEYNSPKKTSFFFLFFFSFFIFIKICFSSILVGGGSSFPNCMQQDYRTKLKKLRRKNRKWVIRMEKEIHFTVLNGYIKTNFGANFYWSKTEKELKLEHKIMTNFFEWLNCEVWESIRLSNLIYGQKLIAMND